MKYLWLLTWALLCVWNAWSTWTDLKWDHNHEITALGAALTAWCAWNVSKEIQKARAASSE